MLLSIDLAFSEPDSKQENLTDQQTATGVVFHDQDGDGRRGKKEPGIAGVRVSSGQEVTRTDENGQYTLPVDAPTILFVCKPSGWTYPTDKNHLPQFYYIHKPDGSPDERFTYDGSAPTGPLPDSVNFPLRRYDKPENFRAVLVGDPQPANVKEVQFYGRDVMSELVGVDASFGLTLGDLVGDRLNLFDDMNELQALAGIPWHNVIGNHDLNRRADSDRYANETFHRVYGPANYAFQYGNVHFIILDNVIYHGHDEGGYHGGLQDRQLAFLKNYLDTVSTDHRVVIATHIPLVNRYWGEQHETPQVDRVMEMLSEFPHTASFSAHTHLNAIYHLGEEHGYHPDDGHGTHIHHNLGTASGTWWKGPLDARGIPITLMRDGTPNGYAIATFEDTDMRVKWKAANHEPDHQMTIDLPDRIDEAQLGTKTILVNVFNGTARSEVKMRVPGETEWIEMDHTIRTDPFYERLHALDHATPMKGTKRLNPPLKSTHIWRETLPDGIAEGAHLLEVKAEDAYGHVFRAQRPFHVR